MQAVKKILSALSTARNSVQPRLVLTFIIRLTVFELCRKHQVHMLPKSLIISTVKSHPPFSHTDPAKKGGGGGGGGGGGAGGGRNNKGRNKGNYTTYKNAAGQVHHHLPYWKRNLFTYQFNTRSSSLETSGARNFDVSRTRSWWGKTGKRHAEIGM